MREKDEIIKEFLESPFFEQKFLLLLETMVDVRDILIVMLEEDDCSCNKEICFVDPEPLTTEEIAIMHTKEFGNGE